MQDVKKAKPSLKKSSLGIKGKKAKTVRLEQQSLIEISSLAEGQTLPLVIRPNRSGIDLISWGRSNRPFLEKHLLERGGILFRGFDVRSPETFQTFIDALGKEALEYKERSSPRSQVQGNIYTSTDYPARLPIFLHNENSYAHTWPRKIFFYCHVEPTAGGETPIADVRRVYRAIPEGIRRKFETKGILYVRNFSEVAGLPWQTVFQSEISFARLRRLWMKR